MGFLPAANLGGEVVADQFFEEAAAVARHDGDEPRNTSTNIQPKPGNGLSRQIQAAERSRIARTKR